MKPTPNKLHTFGWWFLSLAFFLAGLMEIFELVTEGVVERRLGNVGVPPLMDFFVGLGAMGMGGLGSVPKSIRS